MPEKVTEFATGNISIYLQKYDPTRDELQQEYRYYLAHRMIKRLYMSEAITQEEYTDLEHKYREKFNPHLLKILPELTG